MALFKILKGLDVDLPSQELHEGYCWYTTDKSMFYIDFKDNNGNLQRKPLNAHDAETLMGASLATILESSDVEIPTSKLVVEALSKKQDTLHGATNYVVGFDTEGNAIEKDPAELGFTPVIMKEWTVDDIPTE